MKVASPLLSTPVGAQAQVPSAVTSAGRLGEAGDGTVFSNDAQTVVSSGDTSAPADDLAETWTVASPGAFPTVASTTSRPTTFHVADTALPAEVIAITDTSGAIWTVTRGAEGSTPVAHSPGFSAKQVITAGVLATLRDAAAVFNVKTKFLAAGDGVTVDSTALNTAVTALNAAGGGTLLVPAGTYVMSNVEFGSRPLRVSSQP